MIFFADKEIDKEQGHITDSVSAIRRRKCMVCINAESHYCHTDCDVGKFIHALKVCYVKLREIK